MTISNKTVSIFLLSTLILASMYLCCTPSLNEKMNVAFPTPQHGINAQNSPLPSDSKAVDVNSSENTSGNTVTRTPAKRQNSDGSNRIDREAELMWRRLVRSTGLSRWNR